MSIQFKRGTTAQHAIYVGLVGELTFDTDKRVVVLHDGITAGGWPQLGFSQAFTQALADERYSALGGLATQLFSVAPATLDSHAVNLGQFLSSKAVNGYQKLPSGLIIQWGIVNSIVPGGATGTTFPIAFPNACTFVINIPAANNASGNATNLISAKTTTGFSGANWTGITTSFNWLAIGY